jgi:hypothetical protein
MPPVPNRQRIERNLAVARGDAAQMSESARKMSQEDQAMRVRLKAIRDRMRNGKGPT